MAARESKWLKPAEDGDVLIAILCSVGHVNTTGGSFIHDQGKMSLHFGRFLSVCQRNHPYNYNGFSSLSAAWIINIGIRYQNIHFMTYESFFVKQKFFIILAGNVGNTINIAESIFADTICCNSSTWQVSSMMCLVTVKSWHYDFVELRRMS